MNILCACPANCATGGPEAIHWLVSGLNKIEGVDARIWYWDVKSDPPMPEEYKTYGCEYVTDLPAGYTDVIIYPEIWGNHALDHPECTNAIWWLGVDAYAAWNTDPGAFLADDRIIHIAQSAYAYDFLYLLGVKRLMKLTDTLNADFYEDYEEGERGDVVLYNPSKATPFMRELIAECQRQGIEFRPISGMTRAEVIDAMRHSKLYVDFGEFPGRERMPREAALCGCCLITSKIGSADYVEDFTHTYKYDSKPSHIWAIMHKIRYVLDNYDECRKYFDVFRHMLHRDTYSAKHQVEEVAHEIQYHHTCIQRGRSHPQCLGFRSVSDV